MFSGEHLRDTCFFSVKMNDFRSECFSSRYVSFAVFIRILLSVLCKEMYVWFDEEQMFSYIKSVGSFYMCQFRQRNGWMFDLYCSSGGVFP